MENNVILEQPVVTDSTDIQTVEKTTPKQKINPDKKTNAQLVFNFKTHWYVLDYVKIILNPVHKVVPVQVAAISKDDFATELRELKKPYLSADSVVRLCFDKGVYNVLTGHDVVNKARAEGLESIDARVITLYHLYRCAQNQKKIYKKSTAKPKHVDKVVSAKDAVSKLSTNARFHSKSQNKNEQSERAVPAQ